MPHDRDFELVRQWDGQLLRKCAEFGDVSRDGRPFYAEGSKSIAFEIAEQLGWRAPDVLVAPLASGSMYTKIAQGFDELCSGNPPVR